MSKRYLIDIGSSTIKVYRRDDNIVKIIEQKTFNFKDGFTTKCGLSDINKKALFDFFKRLIDKYSLTNSNSKLYATGIFRQIDDKKTAIKDFFDCTGLYFNIITHDLEAFYLEKAWLNKSSKNIGNLLIINIGGKTTELLLCHNGIVTTTEKINFGVGTVLNRYPKINHQYSEYKLELVVDDIFEEIKKQLSPNKEIYDVAIYTGGELHYMECAKYPLIPNSFFEDVSHPYMISLSDYHNRNIEVFSTISIEDLKCMMPKNPEWMMGARACSALAQAICNYYNVRYIVPSNANLIDGVNVQEANKVVVCGSFNKHLARIQDLICKLNKNGICVLSPKCTKVVGDEDGFILFEEDVVENHNTWSVEELHLKAIDECDFVIACNFDNYIGVSTTFELDYAYRKNKKIVFVENNDIAKNFGKRINVYPMPSEIGIL